MLCYAIDFFLLQTKQNAIILKPQNAIILIPTCPLHFVHAPPPDPRYRLALRARHRPPPWAINSGFH